MIRQRLRATGWRVADILAGWAARRRGEGPVLPRVLCYHRVCPIPAGTGLREHYIVSPEGFRHQLDFLAGEGFHVVTAAELVGMLRTGSTLPDRTVAITFDDGFRNNHAVALPILLEAGLRATFYVATSFIGGRSAFPWLRSDAGLDAAAQRDPLVQDVMTWQEVGELAGAGMEVGSHSHSHPDFASLAPGAVRREVETSLDALRNHGISPLTMAASFGVSGPAAGVLSAEMKRAGLAGGFLGAAGPVPPGADLFDLPRITILGADTPDVFARKLTGAYDPLFALHPWWRRLSRVLEVASPPEIDHRVG